MYLYWPNVDYAETDPNYDEFWEHEWTKHGTCSNLKQLDYFSETINMMKAYITPPSLTAAVGKTMSASTLRTDMGGSTYVSLQCARLSYILF